MFNRTIKIIQKQRSSFVTKSAAVLFFVLLNIQNISAQVISNNGGVITVSGGTVINNIGDLNNASGTIANEGAINITGNFTNGGTFSSVSGTVEYYGSGAQSVAGVNYYHLALSTSGTKTFSSGTTKIAGTLSISGASADATTNVTTIEFNGTAAQTINPITYYNLEVSSSGTKTISGAVTVNNNVGIVSGATLLVDSGATLAVHNDIDNSGTLNIDGELTYAP